MEKKIPFQNRILAVVFSLIFSITLIVSLFAFPIELVLFNNQSYSTFLEDEENQSRYPEIISEVLTSELFREIPSNQLPKILSNREGLKIILKKYIPSEWSLSVFNDFTNQVLDYINFRIPDSSLKLEIGQVKSALILKSEAIALDYVSTLPRCSTTINEGFTTYNENLDVIQLPPCKPSDTLLQSFIKPTAFYIEDLINRLPETVSISGVMPYDKSRAENYFFYYSLGRWALRLMPIIAIGLLIVIALLLRPERNVMLGWVGRLLIFTSGFSLIGLVILLIGFDQFVALLINRNLNNLVEGFGALLLGLIQKVGYLTILWVIISVITVLVFGLFLLLVNRLFKPKTPNEISSPSSEQELVREELLPEIKKEEIQPQKEIVPETLEDIEDREKKNSKKKKPKNSNI